MKSFRIPLKHFAIIALFAAVAVLPMLFRGIPGGNDAVQHYEFAQHVVDAMRSGEFFPSFAGNANHGFGDVGLRVYPPLSYYGLAFAYFIFGEWYAASIAVFFFIFLLGGIGVYLWAKEMFSPEQALAAVAIYTFMPFHLNEIYNNFLYAQFAASAVLPFCFLFLTRVLKNGKIIDSLALGAVFAILVLTHLPMTIIGSISLAIYCIASMDRTFVRRSPLLAFSAAIGVALSSLYWVRMVTEMQWVRHSAPDYFSSIWSHSENFLFSLRTLTNFGGDDLSLWFGDLMLFAALVICIPTLVLFFVKREFRPELNATVIVLAFAVFMATPLSSLLWDNLPFLKKLQFPWRWLGIVSIMASVVAGVGLVRMADKLKNANDRLIMLGVAAAMLPFIFLSAFVMKAPHFTPRPEFTDRTNDLSGGETFEGWWPAWASREAFKNKGQFVVSDRSLQNADRGLTSRTFDLEAGEQKQISVSTFYYPHWKAVIDGKQIEVQSDPLGLISFKVPAEAAKIKLAFEEPRIVKISIWVSLVAWIIVLTAMTVLIFTRLKNYGTYS